MKGETASGHVTFKPRARLLKLIGSELISDEVVAVMELVKNAHDADASCVTIEFRGVGRGNGEIVIRDDGSGMSRETLLDDWMEPAKSLKRKRPRTRRGRRVLGEKGVGRFAADKLAAEFELISRTRRSRSELCAVINWDRFDEDHMLSEVRNRWEVRPARALAGHGTILRMARLRSAWTERRFRRLCTRLGRLVSPFDRVDNFSINVVSDEFPAYAGEVRPDFLDRAPYRIEASFDGDDTVTINVNGSRSVRHLWNGTGDLRCGPVRVKAFAFDLETDAVARLGPRTEVRAWLREWSGVSVYRDGFRVWPYGEPHDDWLRLDHRRVNNPVVRLSNNQIVGFVEISADGNPELTDQTNREGFIHNRAFEDLRRLIYFVLQILEAERQAIRHPRGCPEKAPTNGTRSGETVPETLERLARRPPSNLPDQLRELAARIKQEAARDDTHQRNLLDGYYELAGAGHGAVGLHASCQPVLVEARTELRRLRGELAGEGKRRLDQIVLGVEGQLERVSDRIDMIAPLEHTRARRRAIDVAAELGAFRDLIRPLLEAAGVNMSCDVPRRGLLRAEMRPEVFAQLLHVLAMNSLDWLRQAPRPEITVSARARNRRCEVIFADNGPGIPRDLAERVFDARYSAKEGGHGMGLTIARDIVSRHGGTIVVVIDGRRRGATIRFELPRKMPRATIHRRQSG